MNEIFVNCYYGLRMHLQFEFMYWFNESSHGL